MFSLRFTEKAKTFIIVLSLSKNMKTFYITTPIYYPNAEPHIGTAYTTIIADIVARWHTLRGEVIVFTTGLDEHGEKIQEIAEKNKTTPKRFTDYMAKKFKDTWKLLNISYDDFIRTTEPRHISVVNQIFKKIYHNEDIYEGVYKGWYCVSCENFLTDMQLKDRKCPDCNREVNQREEEAYFFKLSKYQKELLDLYQKNPKFISPYFRKKEIIKRVKAGLNDLSISRKNLNWAIPIPIDQTHGLYVWIDALTNYLSVIDYPKTKVQRYWPVNIHFVAKDIMWFHTVIWPALLMSAKIPLPKQIFAHGWLTVNGKKMSKSKGNFITPELIIKKYKSADALRYYIAKEMPFGEDGDFSDESFKNRLNGELANDLGNLVRRTTTIIRNNYKTPVKGKKDIELERSLQETFEKADRQIENLEIDKALETIWQFIRKMNKYINDKKPWEIEDKSDILYNLQESIRGISILISPFLPETAEKIQKQLSVNNQKFKDLRFSKTQKVNKGQILYEKV